jgi:hypothetical protein
MMIQLDPPLPLLIPEKKAWGWAHLVTWNSVEHSLYWTIFCGNGEIRTAPNEKVRAYAPNWTAERDEAPVRWPFREATGGDDVR